LRRAGSLDAAAVEDASRSFVEGDPRVGKEAQALLWSVLEGLPESYREPLVLFYRQDQSVAEVAEALGVSQDVVRQRLSRGRAMLSDRVSGFIESALRHSGPTSEFAPCVVAALPALAATLAR
jgi:zinc protease